METTIKYEDLGNPIVTVQINGQSFPNALVDLGAAIKILTATTVRNLALHHWNQKQPCWNWSIDQELNQKAPYKMSWYL